MSVYRFKSIEGGGSNCKCLAGGVFYPFCALALVFILPLFVTITCAATMISL